MNKIEYRNYMKKNRAWIREAIKEVFDLSKKFYPTPYEMWMIDVTYGELRYLAEQFYNKKLLKHSEYVSFLGIFER